MTNCRICGQPTRSRFGVCSNSNKNATPACLVAYYRAQRLEDPEAYREKNREGNRVRAAAYRERNPELEHTKGKRWRAANKETVAAKGKRWREANPGRMAELVRAWDRAHPERKLDSARRRRGRKHEVPSAPALSHEEMLRQQDYRCFICGKELRATDDLHVDHLIPLSLGGWDVPGNLALAHAVCNLRKGSRIDEFESMYWEAQERSLLYVLENPVLVTFPTGCGVE